MITYNTYLDGDCTLDEYKKTLNLIKPKLNGIYKQESASWAIRHYKIVWQDTNVSVGLLVYDGILKASPKVAEYQLFNNACGFKYQDFRPEYRLIEEVTND